MITQIIFITPLALLLAALWYVTLRLQTARAELAHARREADTQKALAAVAVARADHLENALLQKLHLPPVGVSIPKQYAENQAAEATKARQAQRLRDLGHTGGRDLIADGQALRLLEIEEGVTA